MLAVCTFVYFITHAYDEHVLVQSDLEAVIDLQDLESSLCWCGFGATLGDADMVCPRCRRELRCSIFLFLNLGLVWL